LIRTGLMLLLLLYCFLLLLMSSIERCVCSTVGSLHQIIPVLRSIAKRTGTRSSMTKRLSEKYSCVSNTSEMSRRNLSDEVTNEYEYVTLSQMYITTSHVIYSSINTYKYTIKYCVNANLGGNAVYLLVLVMLMSGNVIGVVTSTGVSDCVGDVTSTGISS
jgi:hypothetical protein